LSSIARVAKRMTCTVAPEAYQNGLSAEEDRSQRDAQFRVLTHTYPETP
jgi:hypothetical protein